MDHSDKPNFSQKEFFLYDCNLDNRMSDLKKMDDKAVNDHLQSKLKQPLDETILQLCVDVLNPEKRVLALEELSNKRETIPDLALIIWYSFGVVTVLLQEVVRIYPELSPPTMTHASSNRLCSALALLQCVASHTQTRRLFLQAHIPLFLYPFLNTQARLRQYEYLRLTSLGVLGALVKVDDPEVINFLIETEVIPVCMRIMEEGSELSKTVATYIIQKILLDDGGLKYICATVERLVSLCRVLEKMVYNMTEEFSSRILKQIIRCYLRLSESSVAASTLPQYLPKTLMDGTLINNCKDEQAKLWMVQVIEALSMCKGNEAVTQTTRQPQTPPSNHNTNNYLFYNSFDHEFPNLSGGS